MKDQQPHWADQYRDAKPGTLDHKVFLAACSLAVEHGETVIRTIGRIAFEQNCAIWHAAWLYRSEIEHSAVPCMCWPCVVDRKAARQC